MSTPAPMGGIDITIRDQVAGTISPKLQQIATDAESAQVKLDALQSSIAKINAGNLANISQATSGASRSVNTVTKSVTGLSDAAKAADGNIQRFIMQLQILTTVANTTGQSLGGLGGQASAATAGLNNFNSATSATNRGVSAFGGNTRVASAELSVLRGNMNGSTRAAGLFLTQVLGLGPAMNAAFVGFGALAMIGILGTMIEKVAELVSGWGDLKKIQADALSDMLKSEDEEIRLQQQALTNRRTQAGVSAALSGPHAGQASRSRAAEAKFDIQQDVISLQAASDAYNNAKLNFARESLKANPANDKDAAVHQATLSKWAEAEAAAVQQIKTAQSELDTAKLSEKLAQTNDKYSEGKEAMRQYKEAQAALVQGWKMQAQDIAATSDDVQQSLNNFWSLTAVSAQRGSISQQAAMKEVMQSQIALRREYLTSQKEFAKQELDTINSLRDQSDLTSDTKALSGIKDQAKGTAEWATSLDKLFTTKVSLSQQDAISNAQYQQSLGLISGQAAAQEIYNAKLQTFSQLLSDNEEKQARLAQIPGDNRGAINDLQSQHAQLQQQQTDLIRTNANQNPGSIGQAAGGALRQSFPKADFQEVQKDFQDLFKTMGDGFADAAAHSLVYGTSITSALKNVARQGLELVISSLIKMGEQWVIQETIGKALQTANTTAASAAATTVATAWAPAAAFSALATLGTNGVAADAALSQSVLLATGLSFAGAHASGGLIQGRGGPRDDSNVALVSNGEFIMNAAATSQHLSMLKAMNSGAKVTSAAAQQSGASGKMQVTVEDHTLGGTTFQVNHLDDNSVRIIARQEIASQTDGHVANAIANPNSKSSKALGQYTQAPRRRNG